MMLHIARDREKTQVVGQPISRCDGMLNRKRTVPVIPMVMFQLRT